MNDLVDDQHLALIHAAIYWFGLKKKKEEPFLNMILCLPLRKSNFYMIIINVVYSGVNKLAFAQPAQNQVFTPKRSS